MVGTKVTPNIDSILRKIDRGEVSPAYLFYGPDAVNIYKNKDELIKKLIPESLRDQNLKEFYASGTRPISLSNIMADVLDDLLTVPFLFESRKVVVIYDPVELRKPKRDKQQKSDDGKKDKEFINRFCKLIDNLGTSNVIVIIFVEDDTKQIGINKDSKIFKRIQEQGIAIAFELPNIIYELINSLFARNTVNAIKMFKELITEGQEVTSILGLLIFNLRLLYQTKLLLSDGNQNLKIINSRTFLEKYATKTDYLPSEAKYNILKQKEIKKEFVINKLIDFSSNFTLKELDEFYENLVELDIKLNPTQMDLYAPDPNIVFEDFIVKFCEK